MNGGKWMGRSGRGYMRLVRKLFLGRRDSSSARYHIHEKL
jgi:hypothetical protein